MPAGKHRPGYRRPRTGEKRRTRQPLKLDRLPAETRERIQQARADGKTWEETAEAVGLPVTTVHRWYDLRVEQVQRDVLARAEQARQLAAAFSGKGFAALDRSVRNALAAEFFRLLEAQRSGELQDGARAVVGLGRQLARIRQLDQEQERLGLERQKLSAIQAKVHGLRDAIGKKKLSPQELRQKVDEIYGLTEKEA